MQEMIIRDYEVSVWTLQDSFITILKPFGTRMKGELKDPKLKIVDDGTVEFSFNIPLYYWIDGEKIENPLWINTINGTIMASMRKIKVIFDKHGLYEYVQELLITKVTEKHEKDEMICEVECEGLAFHELGKIGYKIALEADDLIEENYQWFVGEKVYKKDNPEEIDYILGKDQKHYPVDEPRGTLQYWNDKVFKREDGNWKWDWVYEVEMDYTSNPGKGFKSDKVYEDDYVSSWNFDQDTDQVTAAQFTDSQEKERVVDLKESNVYNLTQELAKKFGIFCRYEYQHDKDYHITGKRVIYYNSFIIEKLGPIDITYPYDANMISRESDSTDLVTKLYVTTELNSDDDEPITIMNSKVNKTREDYILNFDYLHAMGAITDDQYAEVSKYEAAMYKYNMELIPLSNQIIALEGELPDLKARKTTFINSIALDQERRNASNDLLNSLTDNTGIIQVTAANPKLGIIMDDDPNYIKITDVGVDYRTLKIYKTYNTVSGTLSDEYQGMPEYDEFDNLVRVNNLTFKQNYSYNNGYKFNKLGSAGSEVSNNSTTSEIKCYYPEELIQESAATSCFKYHFSGQNSAVLIKSLSGNMISQVIANFKLKFADQNYRPIKVQWYIAHGKQEGNEWTLLGNYDLSLGHTKEYNINIKSNSSTAEEFQFYDTDINNGFSIKINLSYNDNIITSIPVLTVQVNGKSVIAESDRAKKSSQVYMTYSYQPSLYYERVAEIWTNREIADTQDLKDTEKRIQQIDDLIAMYSQRYNDLLAEKQLAMTRFERLMGPALREGYWAPEEYNDYGDQYLESFYTYGASIARENKTDDGVEKINYLEEGEDVKVTAKFLFDTVAFDGEETNYIESFTKDKQELYYFYPCIKLTSSSLLKFVKEHYNEFNVSFCDVVQSDPKYRTNNIYRQNYHINSLCQYAFMKEGNKVVPVIMVTGARTNSLTARQFAALTGTLYQENNITYDEFDKADVMLTVSDLYTGEISDSYKLHKYDWFIPTETTQMLYPRVQINTLSIRTNNDEIMVKYNDKNLENYNDYTILIRDNSYYVTIKPHVFAREGYELDGQIKFIVSNANTAIYLDAIQVAKENSQPKISYEVKVSSLKQDLITHIYDCLGYIANINDNELRFKNARGYISELELELDRPWNDNITIKNYKTKFEDLFSTIVAQTEQMQKNNSVVQVASSVFTSSGNIATDVIQSSIKKVNLSEAFNKGTLTWDEAEGMWATSDSGVVAIRGGGIFTATQKDADDNWKWNTGITPEGINADLITTGQLDTNRIKIYAGDDLKLQLNQNGLFAYKSVFDNIDPAYVLAINYDGVAKELESTHGIDYKQYVVHNERGLFLIAEKGAPVALENRGDLGYIIRRTNEDVERVAISWDGLTLRNYNNEKVFYADANTGDLTLAGTIYAKAGVFEGEVRAKALFIGEESTQNYIDDEGHLLPSAFGEDVAEGLTKAASLVVDSSNGKILLSSLQFDKLGGSASALNITPDAIKFFSETQSDQASVSITPGGITLGSTGTLKLNASNLILSSGTDTSLSQYISSQTEGLVNQQYLDNKLTGLATEGYVDDSVADLATKAEVASAFSMTDSKIWAGVVRYTSGSSTALQLTDDSISLAASFIHETELDKYSNFTLNTEGLNLHYKIEKTSAEYEADLAQAKANFIEEKRQEAEAAGTPFNEEDVDTSSVTVPQEKTTAQIDLNERGLILDGSDIVINGKPVWSQENIIIMNPNAEGEDMWRKTVASIEEKMESKHDWVLIEPAYSGSVTHTGPTPTTINTNTSAITMVNNNNKFLANTINYIQYVVSCQVEHNSARRANGMVTLIFRNTNDFSDDSPEVKFTFNGYYNNNGWLNINDSHLLSAKKTYSDQGSLVNLCISSTTIYCKAITNSGTASLKNLTLVCKTRNAGTESRAQCSVYYYP